MSLYRPKVYTASKLPDRQVWLHMREDPDWDFVDFTATWIDDPAVGIELAGGECPPEELRASWSGNLRDVRGSDFILLYGRNAPLRGALIECGVAIALGIPILAVALDPSHTWSFHQSVTRFDTFREARQHLLQYTTMIPPTRRK